LVERALDVVAVAEAHPFDPRPAAHHLAAAVGDDAGAIERNVADDVAHHFRAALGLRADDAGLMRKRPAQPMRALDDGIDLPRDQHRLLTGVVEHILPLAPAGIDGVVYEQADGRQQRQPDEQAEAVTQAHGSQAWRADARWRADGRRAGWAGVMMQAGGYGI